MHCKPCYDIELYMLECLSFCFSAVDFSHMTMIDQLNPVYVIREHITEFQVPLFSWFMVGALNHNYFWYWYSNMYVFSRKKKAL